MRKINILRFLLLFIALLVVGINAYSNYRFEEISCMDVRVLREETDIDCSDYVEIDLSGYFSFKNEAAAVDRDTSTIYIAHKFPETIRYQDVEGNLTLSYDDYNLYFAPDPCFSDLHSAAKEGHRFKLIAANAAGQYTYYYVVFTSLPVLCLEAVENTYVPENQPFGTLCLWTPEDPDQFRYSVKTGFSDWHIRGATSSGMDKVPWKLSLKTSKHNKASLSLLGLGEDDDWILNAMRLDDTKLKERLFMDLWNEMAAQTSYNHPMSKGEYVEVVINREYLGVFLLQRRIDAKYLELPSDNIIVKGVDIYKAEQVQGNYEIASTPISEENTFELLRQIWDGDYSMFCPENFIDLSLFMHLSSAMDNASFKNMFYVIEPDASGYSLTMIPWDTDMTFGVCWEDGFSYNYKMSLNAHTTRNEFSWMQEHHPDLQERMSERWQELRRSVLTEENILNHIMALNSQLAESNTLAREHQRWPEYYGGADSLENLCRFIHDKLLLLDEHYA